MLFYLFMNHFKYSVCEFLRSYLDSIELHNLTRLICRFNHCEVRRQRESLVHAETGNQLLRDDVTSAVAGDDYAEDAFVIEPVADKKRGHSVDECRKVRTDRIVVVRAEEYQAVCLEDARINLLCDSSAVEAAAFTTEIAADFI